MNSPNMYWPVYKNIESDVLFLANEIHFCDSQLDVFSIKIADLLFRILAEIESLIKNLYRQENGVEPKTPGAALIDLDEKWKLQKKTVSIVAHNMYFRDDFNREFAPFDYCKNSLNDYYAAYNSVKHDRVKNISKANIRVLIHSLGSLFLLNLYHRDDVIDTGFSYMNDKAFDCRAGSDVFSVSCYDATGLSMSQHMNDSCISESAGNDLNKAVFISKFDDKSFREMHKNFCIDEKDILKRFIDSFEVNTFLEKNPDFHGKSIYEICFAAGGLPLVQSIAIPKNMMNWSKSGRKEVKLNKHCAIYPELFPVEN